MKDRTGQRFVLKQRKTGSYRGEADIVTYNPLLWRVVWLVPKKKRHVRVFEAFVDLGLLRYGGDTYGHFDWARGLPQGTRVRLTLEVLP